MNVIKCVGRRMGGYVRLSDNQWIVLGMLFSKFILFDLIWSYSTTFSSFSFVQGYVNKIAVCLVLSLPLLLPFLRTAGRVAWTVAVLGILTDAFLVSNLMYFRTYGTAIPLDSYRLVGNLTDFTSSVRDSLRWIDTLFPLTTVIACVWVSRIGMTRPRRRNHLLLTLLSCLVAGCFFHSYGGIMREDKDMQNAHYFTVRVPVFTLFGSLFCQYEAERSCHEPAEAGKVEAWLAARSPHVALPYSPGRDNCFYLLLESFESWPLGIEVEGKEITPNLNAFLREKDVFFAPRVLSQVKGGRSIDSQLLFNTGLLPINDGAYSIRYPHSCYPSLVKAFKEAHPDAFTGVVTVDKDITWNQREVAKAFGYDSLVWKKDFVLDERVGSRERLGDRSFFTQCARKLREGDFDRSDHRLMVFITYSGHSPFVLPERLRTISFSSAVPRRMADYLTMAHYTDQAVGDFVRAMRADERFRDAMIVITGDHEGLASDRKPLRSTEMGRRYISEGRFVPLIVLNSPVSRRYEPVMGQVDIYPTLLNLLSLDHYGWTGLGHSVAGDSGLGFAVDPALVAVGDTLSSGAQGVRRAREAWTISDQLIRSDYFQGKY